MTAIDHESVWTHYGLWQSISRLDQHPLGSIRMAGWAIERDTSWTVRVDNMELNLLLSKEEIEFLSECLRQQIQCWVSGSVVMTRHTKMMVPYDIALYFITDAAYNWSPLPSSNLGRMLADNIHSSALQRVWSEFLSSFYSPPRPSRPLHPLTLLRPPASMDMNWESSLGYVFTTHTHSQIVTGSGKFFGNSTCRLGNTAYAYNYASHSCEAESRRATAPPGVIPRGCIILAHSTQALILAARGCCLAPLNASERCLIVAPREVYPALKLMLDSIYSTSSYSIVCEQDWARILPRHRFVIVTVQMLKQITEIASTWWDRVILCDWHELYKFLFTAGFLRRKSDGVSTLLPCQIQIALMLPRKPHPLTSYSHGVLDELGLSLGVPACQLGDVDKTKELVYDRVLSIDRENGDEPSRVHKYEIVPVAPPSTEDKSAASAYGGYAWNLAVQLSTLSQPRRTVATLPSTHTITEFFNRDAPHISPYALSSFQLKETERTCGICTRDGATVAAVTRCGHWFCVRCITQALSRGFKHCPLCRCALSGLKDVLVTDQNSYEHTTFVDSLIAFLQERMEKEQYSKMLVVCSYRSSLERVACALRLKGINALSWSGNARQLSRNLDTFNRSPKCALLNDPEFLSLKWTRGYIKVQHICCLLPLDTDRVELCCQIRDVVHAAPGASLSFMWDAEICHLPQDKPTCECATCDQCPILLPHTSLE